MCFSGPSIPAATAPPPVATPSDPTVVAALNAERLRQSQATGRQSTVLTTNIGQQTSASPKTILGQ